VTFLPQPNHNRDNVRRYQKCADMMLEMRQTHDACSNFLEAAVSLCVCLCLCLCVAQQLFLALQLCFKKCNIPATVKCYESACRIQVKEIHS